jgi:LysR family transcriptional regulator, carnitine catabolism transcriptional activator
VRRLSSGYRTLITAVLIGLKSTDRGRTESLRSPASPQPAQLIKELESQVGFRLFDRTTRSVDLTPHGSELLGVIQKNLEELDAAISSIGHHAMRGYQPLSHGTTPLVAANILRPAMREFRKQRPDVGIQLFDADLPTLTGMMESGRLAMSLEIFNAIPSVRREPFFRFSLMVG